MRQSTRSERRNGMIILLVLFVEIYSGLYLVTGGGDQLGRTIRHQVALPVGASLSSEGAM
jgi:hypothetical protein